MKFYRLKSVFPGHSIATPFIGYVCRTRTHTENGREMVLLTMTTEEGRKQWANAYFYWDDLEEVTNEGN
jgi:hypothetical protein